MARRTLSHGGGIVVLLGLGSCLELHPAFAGHTGSGTGTSGGSAGPGVTESSDGSLGTGSAGSAGSAGSTGSTGSGVSTGAASSSRSTDTTGGMTTGTTATAGSTSSGSGGTSGNCSVELCNGGDDDCDGLVDEVSNDNLECNGCSLAQLGGYAFWFCTQSQSWADARHACMGLGADLTAVADMPTDDLLTARIGTGAGQLGATFWIGANDLDVADTWVWADGTPWVYDNWDVGEPNNFGGGESCGRLVSPPQGPVGTWEDDICDKTHPFSCWSAHIE